MQTGLYEYLHNDFPQAKRMVMNYMMLEAFYMPFLIPEVPSADMAQDRIYIQPNYFRFAHYIRHV